MRRDSYSSRFCTLSLGGFFLFHDSLASAFKLRISMPLSARVTFGIVFLTTHSQFTLCRCRFSSKISFEFSSHCMNGRLIIQLAWSKCPVFVWFCKQWLRFHKRYFIWSTLILSADVAISGLVGDAIAQLLAGVSKPTLNNIAFCFYCTHHMIDLFHNSVFVVAFIYMNR